MFNTRPLHKISVFFCIALFAAGILRLFWLRFEAGDLYPPYSSLRSDPLGVQVLYESIQELRDQEISRNFRPLGQLKLTAGTTLVICGLTNIPSAASDSWETLLENVADGGRLVVSISSRSRVRTEEKTAAEDKAEENATDADEDSRGKKPQETPTLGIALRDRTLGETHADQAVRQEVRKAVRLPETLVFRSSLFFELDDPAWEAVFSFENEPVVARRTWGEGEVVMIADSYPFSNEALRNHRASDFLAWTVGSGGPVVFDEYHHGLARQPGISALMRKYRLHGVVLSLAVVVALLIWQRAVVFAPRPANDNDGRGENPGTDAAGGWVSLMRRHIASADLMSVCLEAWESSTASDIFSKEQVGQVRDMISRQGKGRQRRNPVALYRSICELLKRGKTP